MFKPVSNKVHFPSLEQEVLSLWQREGTFRKSVDRREGAPEFVFYEGPPTANGSPGIHHVLARAFKDIIPRYKTMQGYHCLRRAGWDCHGLPVELEVEKELGFATKSQIEQYGVDRFNARCRESVFRYLKEWQALTERIGFWLDLEHPYVTLTNEYIESVWWIIRRLWDKGLLYRGHRVTPHCPRCGTSLSSHEVALGYRDDAEDPSVYIKLRLRDSARAREMFASAGDLYPSQIYFMAWTTTPWTLPANTALAVAAGAEYALVAVDGAAGKECLILARNLLPSVVRGDYKVILTMRGAELQDLAYEPLYPPADCGGQVGRFEGGQVQPVERLSLSGIQYQVTLADYVSLDDGTGIVHTAPAYGEVDFEQGKAQGLLFVHPVDEQGIIKGNYSFSGRFVKDADAGVIADLQQRGLLYRSERIRHTYPFCWRCDSPLLYYAKDAWYARTTAIKDKLIQGNEEINWYPAHIKEGRFGDWLRNNVDWALSRERYWGTPLPIWRCDGCGHEVCIGSIEELTKLAHHRAMARQGSSLEECLKDLHRPLVDRILLRCPEHADSTKPDTMRRVPDVIDCWFDSGAMPVAQWHYPLENQELFRRQFPADYISEAIDQTRGWFYTLHAISTLLFEQPCFRNVICLGHILDAQGEKMSKARGNVVDPWQVIAAHGADALRWSMFTASPPGNPRRFSPEQVQDVVRRFLLTLWNTYSFFVTYANLDGFNPAEATPPAHLSLLDRWILSELQALIQQVAQELDNYDPTHAGRRIADFVDLLSNWYVRRSRRRFWKSENDADKLAAYFTLYRCLVTLSHLLAPFIPFTAEAIYQNLVRSVNPKAEESVHLTRFPQAEPASVDQGLMEGTRLAIKLCSLGRAARSSARIKVRQPLARAVIQLKEKREQEGLAPLLPQIMEELNVKAVEFADDGLLGGANYSVAEEEGYGVAVETKLTPELLGEGTARELVHLLQTMRRNAGFDIADRITTYYEGEATLEAVMLKYASYIQQETLSLKLVPGTDPEAHQERHRIGGKEIVLGVKKS